jgi:hypothetical protein
MERRYFELDRGYLNINEHALYFTRSGNWQDALATPELRGRFSPRRTIHLLFGGLLTGARALFEVLHLPTHGPEGLLLTAGLAGLGVLVLLRGFRHDLAPIYHIPSSKLLAVSTTERDTTLRFLDGAMKERKMTVKLPPEALEIMATWLEHGRADRTAGG